LALEAECRFPRFPGESISDFAARAAGVSRDRFEDYRAIIESGARPPVEMLSLHLFMDRVGRRLVALTAGDSFHADTGRWVARPQQKACELSYDKAKHANNAPYRLPPRSG
jgi:hypothetical protein